MENQASFLGCCTDTDDNDTEAFSSFDCSKYVVFAPSPVLQKCSEEICRKKFAFIWKLAQAKMSVKQKSTKNAKVLEIFVSCLLHGTLESKLLVLTLKIFKTVKLTVIEIIIVLNGKYFHF